MDILAQHRKDMEMQMEQQQKDMNQRIEQQQLDMSTFNERSLQTIINQVPLIIQNVYSSMIGVFNIAPL
jgi:hypothetical protein